MRWAANSGSVTPPKHATRQQYKQATALEALVGPAGTNMLCKGHTHSTDDIGGGVVSGCGGFRFPVPFGKPRLRFTPECSRVGNRLCCHECL